MRINYEKETTDVISRLEQVGYHGETISEHRRCYDGLKAVEWNGDRFKKWVAKYGDNTLAVINVFLNNFKIEQKSYKSCRVLLFLADKYSEQRLEAACAKAFSYMFFTRFLGK